MIFNFIRKQAKRFLMFCISEENRTVSKVLLIIIAMGMIVQLYTMFSEKDRYIYNKNSNLIGVYRKDLEGSESIPLSISVTKDGKTVTANVVIDTVSDSSNAEEDTNTDNQQTDLKSLIGEIVSAVSESEGQIIYLPLKYETSTSISWKRQRNYSIILLVLLFPLSMGVLNENRKSKAKKVSEKQTSSIKLGIPRFCNQLLLLLNSGVVFDDAFYRIAKVYEERREEDYFQEMIIQIKGQSINTSDSPMTVLTEQSRKFRIRELDRLIAIIDSSQRKGTNLSSTLERESEILWDERKKSAEEKGKAAEVKLSFPLAILLIVLIVITAAPAMLQM